MSLAPPLSNGAYEQEVLYVRCCQRWQQYSLAHNPWPAGGFSAFRGSLVLPLWLPAPGSFVALLAAGHPQLPGSTRLLRFLMDARDPSPPPPSSGARFGLCA